MIARLRRMLLGASSPNSRSLRPGDHMSPGDGPNLSGILEPGKIGKLLNVDFVGAPCFEVGDVGEPLEDCPRCGCSSSGGTSASWSNRSRVS